jgi:xanthine dehydrogenase small subunit
MSPAESTQPLRFFHQGRMVEVDRVHPTRSVLDWLREDARCTGTKEGCNEGDCGACTVVVGELAPSDGAQASAGGPDVVGGLTLRAVNACIQFLPTLHGKALFTVEDLQAQTRCTDGRARDESPHEKHAVRRLHPVQQAMVECHASQCGFCTPGFVMSLWSTYERHGAAGTRPTRQQLADDLSGNLCRCTGYRPILDAGQRMFDLPAVPLDTRAAVEALTRLHAAPAGSTGSTGFRYAATRDGRTDTFHAPATLDELAALRERLPDAQLLAGSTDVGLWVNKQFRDLGDIVFVGGVAEMKTVQERGVGDAAELFIGAGASLEDAWRALVERVPSLADVWLRFASPPIRHAGTMGGNVANGSPIGDSAPVLMALDAQVELRRGARVRRLPLADFYVGYMKNRLEAGEFVQGIAVPLTALRRQVRAYKISKRFDSDISALCAGFAIEFEAPGDGGDIDGRAAPGEPVVKAVRLAFGGMAATVCRAARAEAALVGRPWTPSAVAAAQAALAEDFKPLSDLRASAAYRLKVAQNLLQRLWLETRADDPLPNAAVSVWDSMPHVLPAPITEFAVVADIAVPASAPAIAPVAPSRSQP